MLDWLLNVRINSVPFLVTIDTLSAVAFVFLILRRPTWRWVFTVVIAVVAGLGLGYLACWLASDVFDVFGVGLTPITRMWVAFGFAGVAVAIVNLTHSRWWRKIIAIVCIPLFLATAATGINVEFAMYQSVGDVLGLSQFSTGSLAHERGDPGSTDASVVSDWKPPADLPSHGRVVSVKIPGTVSHFDARPAVLYLPPAALVASPPVLPVIIMMSGQPGNPSNVFTAGHVNSLMDAYASAHHGLAPIVLSPDQLGEPSNNPMCVNSPLGNSATYITVDVVRWIRAHLLVSTNASGWGVAGFSQGATCAVQFTAGYPQLFDTTVAISSELAPTIGASTVATAFGGSQAAYNAAMPLTLFAKNAPFVHQLTVFGVGENDAKYRAFAAILAPAAAKAGMKTQLIISPNTAHDWNTVRYVMENSLPAVAAHLGLAP
jgi:S-formylglutathione hydrolase FrmB